MDAKYLDISTVKGSCFRLESYRSFGTVSSVHSTTLRCYFIRKCEFINPNPTKEQFHDIRIVSEKSFLEKAAANTLEVYQNVMKQVLIRSGPVIEMFDVQCSREKRLVVGFKHGTTQSFFSAMSDLYHFYDLYTTRKYVGNLPTTFGSYNYRAIFKWRHYLQFLSKPNAKLKGRTY
jgi:glutamate dehydrogenase